MTRPIDLSVGEFYHLYNRGTEKRKTFLTPYDYERFVVLLYLCNNADPIPSNINRKAFDELISSNRGETLVDIGVYCLMPNHFHILVHEKTENGISRFVQKLITAYTMYFNKKNDRSGALFQGKFKAEHVDKDEYLKYLFGYIHLNPVKLIDSQWKEGGIKNLEKAEKFLDNYHYSSYKDFTEKIRSEKAILNTKVFPKYFETGSDFKEMMNFWLNFSTNDPT